MPFGRQLEKVINIKTVNLQRLSVWPAIGRRRGLTELRQKCSVCMEESSKNIEVHKSNGIRKPCERHLQVVSHFGDVDAVKRREMRNAPWLLQYPCDRK